MANSEPNAMSIVLSERNPDGTYTAVLPINTIEEVYVDTEKKITLDEYLETNVRQFTVNSEEEKFQLTENDGIKFMDIVRVVNPPSQYFVIDVTNLNNEAGYTEIGARLPDNLLYTDNLATEGGNNAGKIPVLNEDGILEIGLDSSSLADLIAPNNITVDTKDKLLLLTISDVKKGDLVKVTTKGDTYIVTDTTKLGTYDAFDIITISADSIIKSTVARGILQAAHWVNKEQTIRVIGITSDTIGTIGVAETATDEQFEMASLARLRKIHQGTDTVTIRYTGLEPDIDIPIEVHME